ncbi:MAG: multiheme c-type cytochrome [Candidatus Methanoperedens sp.]|nr:multiheme c-type cytochrome [Candidatus Methanoperedens sp.]
MNSKIILMSVAVIAVGLFAMPSTLSLFAGQHNFVSADNVTCQKCHQDIYDNIQNSDMHKNLGDSSAWNSGTNDNALGKCVGCHRVSDSFTNVSGVPSAAPGRQPGWFNQTPDLLGFGSTHTMVVTLECTQCHTDVATQFNDSKETHQPYYLEALNGTTGSEIPLNGANEACLGCHSHTAVTFNWTRPTGYNANVSEDASHKYTIAFSKNLTSFQSNITSGQ